jgi:hypothetical protein
MIIGAVEMDIRQGLRYDGEMEATEKGVGACVPEGEGDE